MFSEDGYRALTTRAGVVRRGDRGVLTVSGPDRLSWLQGLLTNDVESLQVGGVCDAAYLTPQGRMITDIRVVNLSDRTLLDVPAALSAALQTRLDALIFSEEAQVIDSSSDILIVDLHGPTAPTIVQNLEGVAGERSVAFVRDDPFELPGYSAFVAANQQEPLVRELLSAGASETTLETLDVVRIEAGRPAFLVDMDEHTIPLEAGLERRAISFTKGCYVGQEVIVRVTHRGGGRVARRLVGLRVSGNNLPKAGDVIHVGEREIGRVTSATWSPALASAIGLGYVHRDFVESGTVVQIRHGDGILAATVSALPLVSRQISLAP